MLFVPLCELKGRNKFALLRFLCRYEYLCVQFSSVLKKNVSNAYAVYVSEFCPQDLYGILCLKKTVFHIFPFIKSDSETALQKDFVDSFVDFYRYGNFQNPVCINGAKSGTDLLLKCFERFNLTPLQVNEYNLLKLEGREFLLNLKGRKRQGENLEIIHCKKDMPEESFRKILRMQISYEQEEVVPDCFEFNEDSCRLRFLNSIRTQLVMALKNEENQFVAKGGTNAVGFKYVQAGGVFTEKEFRGRHYARYLMEELLFRVLKIRKSVVLFVKKENIPAGRLYNSLSFKKISDYSIAYFSYNL